MVKLSVLKNKLGQSLIEVLLAIALAAIIFPAIFSGLAASRQGVAQQNQRIAASALLKETQDEVRSVRENGWKTFAGYGDGTFYPVASSGTWTLVPGAETTSDGFIRQVVIADVYRNSSDVIASSGDLDPSTKQITVTITWNQPYSSSITGVGYLTRFRDNITYTETTVSDFNKGTNNNTSVVSTPNTFSGDGQVQLTARPSGAGDWCKPSQTINYYSLSGNSVGIAASAEAGLQSGSADSLYVATGGNASSNPLYTLNITDPPYPTPPVVTTSLTNSDNNKGYKLFSTASYVFFTTDHPNLAVDIVSRSDLSRVGYFDDGAHGSIVGENTGIFVSGNVGYVSSDVVFYTFDVSTIKGSSSQTKLSSVNLANSAKGNKVIVSGNYAYIATTSTTSQLQIINVQNPSSLGSPITLDVGNSQPGIDLAISGNYLYLVTRYASPDFYVIDISDPTSPKVVGSATTTGSMDPTGVSTVPAGSGNVVIVVGNSGDQYQIFNIATPSNPYQCGKLTNPNGATKINAIATEQEPDSEVYSYILTVTGSNNQNQQLMIIAGGPSGLYASTNGIYTSQIFSPGYQTAFNRFLVDYNLPSSVTTLKLQLAVAPLGSDNTCGTAQFTFVGPDGGSSTGYSTNGYWTYTDPSQTSSTGIVPFNNVATGYQNPGNCFQYKVYLNTTDSNSTPVFNDITVNYSP